MSEITKLLALAAEGQTASANALMPLIYERLRVIAHRQLAGERSWTIATTGLVHEAYLQLFGDANLSWRDRGHFFAYAATAMRHILIDRARQRLSQKQGGAHVKVDVDEVEVKIDDDCVDLLALDQALGRMAVDHPRLVQMIEMRFFAGLSIEEVGQALEIDARTVKRDWQKARAFIHQALKPGQSL